MVEGRISPGCGTQETANLELLRGPGFVESCARIDGRTTTARRPRDLLDDEGDLAVGDGSVPARRHRDVRLRDDRHAAHLKLDHLLLDVSEVVVRSAAAGDWRHQVLQLRIWFPP